MENIIEQKDTQAQVQDELKVDEQAETKIPEKKSKKTKTIIGLMVFFLASLVLIFWVVGFGSSSPGKNTMTVKDKNSTMPGFSVENASQTLVNDAGNSNVSTKPITSLNSANANSNRSQIQGIIPTQPLNQQTDPIFGKDSPDPNSRNVPVTQLVVDGNGAKSNNQNPKTSNPSQVSQSSDPLFGSSKSSSASSGDSSDSGTSSDSPTRSSQSSSAGQSPDSPQIPLESTPASQSSYFLFGKKVDEAKSTYQIKQSDAANDRLIGQADPVKSVETAKKPPFGTLIPLQTLGAISTLGTTPLVRMVLTRNISGSGWQLPRGTVFVGRISGGNSNRAFVEVIGFLDSKQNAFIRISGDLQGIDGANGLIGESKKIGSIWKNVLREVADKAYQTANTWISRNTSGTNIALPNPTASLNNNSTGNINYVLVKPNSFGYLFINDLPKTIQAETAELPVPDVTGQDIYSSPNQYLPDGEVMNLVSTGTPAQIRKSMPKIRPEYRAAIEEILQKKPE